MCDRILLLKYLTMIFFISRIFHYFCLADTLFGATVQFVAPSFSASPSHMPCTHTHAHIFALTELCLLCVRSFDSPLVQCCWQSHPWPSLNNNFIFSLLLFTVLMAELLQLLLFSAVIYILCPHCCRKIPIAQKFCCSPTLFFHHQCTN